MIIFSMAPDFQQTRATNKKNLLNGRPGPLPPLLLIPLIPPLNCPGIKKNKKLRLPLLLLRLISFVYHQYFWLGQRAAECRQYSWSAPATTRRHPKVKQENYKICKQIFIFLHIFSFSLFFLFLAYFSSLFLDFDFFSSLI